MSTTKKTAKKATKKTPAKKAAPKAKTAPKAAKPKGKAAPKLTAKQIDALKRVAAEALPVTAYDKRTINALEARKLVKASIKAGVTLTDAGSKFLGAGAAAA